MPHGYICGNEGQQLRFYIPTLLHLSHGHYLIINSSKDRKREERKSVVNKTRKNKPTYTADP